MTKKVSYEKSRLKELLWLMMEKFQPACYICKEQFKKSDVLPSRGVDQLTEHHIDINHYNNDLANRTLAHRTCHKRLHTRHNITFAQMFRGMGK